MPKVRILTQYCKGCGLCVKVCAGGKLHLSETVDKRGLRVVEARDNPECTGCGNCAAMCPDAAIELDE